MAVDQNAFYDSEKLIDSHGDEICDISLICAVC